MHWHVGTGTETQSSDTGTVTAPQSAASVQDLRCQDCHASPFDTAADLVDTDTAVRALFPGTSQEDLERQTTSSELIFIQSITFRRCKCLQEKPLWHMSGPSKMFRRLSKVKEDFKRKLFTMLLVKEPSKLTLFARRARRAQTEAHTFPREKEGGQLEADFQHSIACLVDQQAGAREQTAGPSYSNAGRDLQNIAVFPLLSVPVAHGAASGAASRMPPPDAYGLDSVADPPPPPPLHPPQSAHSPRAARTFIQTYILPLHVATLDDWCWTSCLLQTFLEAHYEHIDGLESIIIFLRGKALSGNLKGKDLRDYWMQIIRDKVFPGEQVCFKKVLNRELRKLLNDDTYLWNIMMKESILDIDDETFMLHLEKFCKDTFKQHLNLHSVVPGSSFAIFFSLPSWLARLFLFNIKHQSEAQDKLVELGYRSFSYIPPTTPLMLGASTGGVSEESREREERLTVICGYNIGMCPPDVGTGVSIVGSHISQEQRDLVQKVCVRVRECVFVHMFLFLLFCVCVSVATRATLY